MGIGVVRDFLNLWAISCIVKQGHQYAYTYSQEASNGIFERILQKLDQIANQSSERYVDADRQGYASY